MSNYDFQYLKLVDKVLEEGVINPCRTGNNTHVLLNQVITHDLEDGFPILTFRQMPFKGACGELECFLHGYTNKEQYEAAKCMYWKEWCRPDQVPYGDKENMLKNKDLGPIYGWQWKFGGTNYIDCNTDYTGQGADQIKYIIDTLKKNKYDRRLVVSAWNLHDQDKMALPPCVYAFQLNYFDNRLHMTVNQRSCDLILGVPTDIVFYSILLQLICNTVKMTSGTITFNLCNCHVYDNHVDIYNEHRKEFYNNTFNLPTLNLDVDADVFNFTHDMASLDNYEHGPKVSFPIAV